MAQHVALAHGLPDAGAVAGREVADGGRGDADTSRIAPLGAAPTSLALAPRPAPGWSRGRRRCRRRPARTTPNRRGSVPRHAAADRRLRPPRPRAGARRSRTRQPLSRTSSSPRLARREPRDEGAAGGRRRGAAIVRARVRARRGVRSPVRRPPSDLLPERRVGRLRPPPRRRSLAPSAPDEALAALLSTPGGAGRRSACARGRCDGAAGRPWRYAPIRPVALRNAPRPARPAIVRPSSAQVGARCAALRRFAVSPWFAWAPLAGLRHDLVDDAERELVGRGEAHRDGGLLGHLRIAPQDARAALGADDRVDRVLEREDDVADARSRARRPTRPRR